MTLDDHRGFFIAGVHMFSKNIVAISKLWHDTSLALKTPPPRKIQLPGLCGTQHV